MEKFPKSSTGVDQTTSMTLRKLLIGEIALGTAINICFNLFFAWLTFGDKVVIRREEVMLDILPATFIPALLMTIPVTLLIRKRLQQGLSVTPSVRLRLFLPRSVIWRAPVVALFALAIVAVPVTLLLWLFSAPNWNWSMLIMFKLAFSLFHSAAITPIVVLAALGEDRSMKKSSYSVTS